MISFLDEFGYDAVWDGTQLALRKADVDAMDLVGRRLPVEVGGHKVKSDAVADQGEYGVWHGFTFMEGPAKGASFTVIGEPTAEKIAEAGQNILDLR